MTVLKKNSTKSGCWIAVQVYQGGGLETSRLGALFVRVLTALVYYKSFKEFFSGEKL